eukprot:COSAG05_NODE_741_length_7601_cov_8.262997_3_plen_150_part_00
MRSRPSNYVSKVGQPPPPPPRPVPCRATVPIRLTIMLSVIVRISLTITFPVCPITGKDGSSQGSKEEEAGRGRRGSSMDGGDALSFRRVMAPPVSHISTRLYAYHTRKHAPTTILVVSSMRYLPLEPSLERLVWHSYASVTRVDALIGS